MISVIEFIKKNGGKYPDEVIEYCQKCMNIVDKDKGFKNNFNKYNVSKLEFLNLLLKKSNTKLQRDGTEALDKAEFDRVFQNVLIYNEVTNLIMDGKEHVKMKDINIDGTLDYIFDDYAIEFFKTKYNVDFSV